jgi:CO/xanthine dehydrogenase Mo-binding subunit
MDNQFNRRQFLKAGGGGVLAVGFSLSGLPLAGAAVPAANGLPAPKSVAKDTADSWLTIARDGRVTVYVGKVDLGTGTRTAMAQLAADELDVAFERIEMVMGDTATTPDQWMTGANLTIAQGGMELRRAAATARRTLLERASQRLGAPLADLIVEGGIVRVRDNPSRFVRYGDLIGDGLQVPVDAKVELKKADAYRVIGRSIPRVDIPAKVSGAFTYMHDFRLPGMLHARVIRPQNNLANLLAFDDSESRKVAGFMRTVRKGDFLAVIAKNEWAAVKAARAMKADWSAGTPLPDKATVFDTWRQRPIAKEDVTQKVGDAQAALAAGARRIKASYHFSVQTHASIGPSCSVADFKDGKLTIWSASQATHSLQHEVAGITGLPQEAIRVLYLDGSGCYGRNGHEDASADAALLATLIGKPVRVQWMRADETARSPKSPPRTMDMEAGLDADGNISAWSGDFTIALNHIVAFKPLDFPLLAGEETGKKRPGNWVGFLFQNSGIPYGFPNVRVNTRHVAETFFRSAHLRSPGRIENSFANESFFDELASAAKADPAAFRLKYLTDPRGQDVIRAAMKLANWESRPSPAPAAAGDIARGRGISYIRYNNSTTYVAAVAEVEVNRQSGEIKVTRLCISHDCGEMVNPDGVANQVEGGAIQTVSRTLMEEVQWDRQKVNSVDWGSYPIIRMPDIPKVELSLINRPGTAAWGAGEPTACTVPGAIGNAVFDAIGVRLREIPFTPDRVKAALGAASPTA